MKFIRHSDIQPGDVVAWAYDSHDSFLDEENAAMIPSRPPSLIYYEVSRVERDGVYQTVVFGASFGKDGKRHQGSNRDWDLVPSDREILLISRGDDDASE